MIRIFDIEMVTENNDINNDYNIFSNDLDGQEENLFNQQIDKELEVIPKTTLNPKVIRVVKICKLPTTRMPTKLSSKSMRKGSKGKFIF